MRLLNLSCWLCLAAAVGCSMGKGMKDSGLSDSLDDTFPQDEDTSDTSDAWGDPVWLSLQATLPILKGELTMEKTSLSWAVLDKSESAICVASSTPEQARAQRRPVEGIYIAWNFTLSPYDSDCGRIKNQLPLAYGLGIGELHPDLAATLGAAGYEGLQTSVYGVYLSPESDWKTIWAFGIAGTADDFKGGQTTVSEPPLPDGDYTVESIYLMEYNSILPF